MRGLQPCTSLHNQNRSPSCAISLCFDVVQQGRGLGKKNEEVRGNWAPKDIKLFVFKYMKELILGLLYWVPKKITNYLRNVNKSTIPNKMKNSFYPCYFLRRLNIFGTVKGYMEVSVTK
jgi:hypothetical protein